VVFLDRDSISQPMKLFLPSVFFGTLISSAVAGPFPKLAQRFPEIMMHQFTRSEVESFFASFEMSPPV
jgi:hypothetical protein